MNQLLQEGRYRINHQFTSNGTAAVYDAYDTVRNTNVLVKEINVRLNRVMTTTQQEQLKLAFANQARALTEIKHDALLHVHDFFSEIGRQYLVMEALDGEELSDLIASRDVRYSLEDMLGWADQILDGLTYLHKFNPAVIHKNIKPNHIKLTAEGRVKLLAFGLADGSDTKITTNLVSDLSREEICYSPLEQIWDDLDPASQKVISNSYDERSEKGLLEPLDSRSDIYAFGATFYHLLTGRKPVDALERSIEILDGKHDPLTPPHELKASIPPEVSDVIMKSMEVKREDRFDSAAILRQILRTAMIRAREREEVEEANEEREAVEAIRVAGQTRNLKGQNPLDTHNPFEKGNAEPTEEESPKQHMSEPPVYAAAEPANIESSAIHVSEDAIRASMLEQKLREAEEQRKAAEERAAEAEKLLREKEAFISSPSISVEDSLLDLGTSSNPSIRPLNPTGKLPKLGTFAFERNTGAEIPSEENKPAAGLSEPVVQPADEPVLAMEITAEENRADKYAFETVTEYPETALEGFDTIEAETALSSNYETVIDPVETPADVTFETDRPMSVDHAYDVDVNVETIEQAAAVNDEFEVAEAFETGSYSSSIYVSEDVADSTRTLPLPMPLMLGGVALLFFVIVGGAYMMLSGSGGQEADIPKQMIEDLKTTEPANPPLNTAQSETTEPVQPAETVKSAETEQAAQTPDNSAAATELQPNSSDQPDARRTAAAAPTPAKQRRPADMPERQPAKPKRQVTVDDLIRDN